MAAGKARAPQSAAEADIGGRSDHWQHLRTRIIEFGIRVIWGKQAFPASMAADIPLMRAGLRMAWLRTLGAVGVKNFVTRSGLGYDFVCHVGDLAEYPYYHRCAFQHELAICAGWLQAEQNPVVYDVGANVGVVHLDERLGGEALELCDTVEGVSRPTLRGAFRALDYGANRLVPSRGWLAAWPALQ